MRRTLVTQTAFLGDLVLTQPLIAELARAAGEPVDVLVRAPYAPLAATFAGVREAIPDDKRGTNRGIGGLIRARARIRAGRYDRAVSPHKSFRTGLLLASSGIRERIGFARAPGAFFFNRTVADPGGPYPDRLRALSAAAGAGPGADDPVLEPTPVAIASVDAKLQEAGVLPGTSIAVVNPGSVWGTKRWLPEGYGSVARSLAGQGFVPVVTGGPEDVPVARAVEAAAGGAARTLAGKTSLLELVALARRASVFVTGDSGPMHIAAAVGTPVVAIFGPTTPALGFAPRTPRKEIVERDLDCRPCHRHGPQVCPLGHFRCMREIEPVTVLAAVERLVPLAGRKAGG